jgi:hypothetical protein
MPMPNLLAMSQEILLALDCRLPHFLELRTLTNGIEQRAFLQDRESSFLGWPYVTAGAPRRAVRTGSAAGHAGKAALHQSSHV